MVDYIRVARYGDMTRSFFSCDGSMWVGPMTADHIRQVIDHKDANVDDYLRHCGESWLIIAADGHRMATWFDDDAQVRAATFISRFARVFLLRNLGHQLIELTAARP